MDKFCENVQEAPLSPRRALAAEFAINSLTLIAVTGGVIEFGTGDLWTKSPHRPNLSVSELQHAFEDFSAIYIIIWVYDESNGKWAGVSDYVPPERAEALKNVRNDTESYTTMSRKMLLGPESIVA